MAGGVIQEIQFAMDQAAIEQLIAESARQGDRIGKKLTDAIGKGGKDKARTVATAMMGELARELERNESRVKESLARGLISPAAATKAAEANARAYNAGILKAMDQLRAKGALTNEAFIEMTKNLKNVGAASSEVDRTTGSVSKLGSLAAKVGGIIGGLFAFNKIKLFGEQSIEEFKRDEAALNRLDSALIRMGTSATALAVPLRQVESEFRRLRLDEDETQEILGTLIGRTNKVAESFENVGLVVDLARREHMDFASASQIVANLMNGNVMRLRMLGINATTAKEAMAELRRETAGEGLKWASTLEGKLTGLNVLWGNFKAAVGQAMIEAGGGTSIIDTLSATIQTMTTWVMENHEVFVMLKDAIVEVTSAFAEMFRTLNLGSNTRISFVEDMASMEKSLNSLQANLFIFAGNVRKTFGDLIQAMTFGALGDALSASGQRMMDEGERRLEEIESKFRARVNRSAKADRGKVGPDEGESLGTLRGTTIIPSGPGGPGGRDAIREAAEAKRLAAELKKAHDETITNAIKLVETESGRLEGLFVLRGEERELKKALDSTTMSIHDRIEAMLKLTEVQAAIKKGRQPIDTTALEGQIDRQMGITPATPGPVQLSPAEQEAIRRSVAEQIASGGLNEIPTTLPSVGTTFDLILGDMRENSADVATSIADNFSEAFERMKEDGWSVNSILSNLGKGMAKSILGEIAKVAKGEALQALANAIKFTAIGLGQAATGNPLAGKSFAAAATHAKSAAAWGLLAGSMGSIGGGGGSSGGGGGSDSNDRTSSADTMNRSQSVLHIHLDGVDPWNPRHQDVIAEANRRYGETNGDQRIVYHPGGGR